MSTLSKRLLWVFGCAVIAMASFALGRWSGALKESLAREASYPWALHKKLSNIDTTCEVLRTAPKLGKFIVQATDGGETLLITAADETTKTVNAFAVSSGGQVASDSWPIECK
jgi:hypothetical protein